MHDYNKNIDEALRLRSASKMKESIEIAGDTIDLIPSTDITSLCAIGAVLLEGKDFVTALKCFARAVDSSPLSAPASIGLFHALWNSGQRKEAFAELRRFLSISESEEHFRLVEEMRDAVKE